MWESHPSRIRVMLVTMDSAMYEKDIHTYVDEGEIHVPPPGNNLLGFEFRSTSLFFVLFCFFVPKIKFLFNAFDLSSTATLLCTVLLLLFAEVHFHMEEQSHLRMLDNVIETDSR